VDTGARLYTFKLRNEYNFFEKWGGIYSRVQQAGKDTGLASAKRFCCEKRVTDLIFVLSPDGSVYSDGLVLLV
jgi:hypothetical protein